MTRFSREKWTIIFGLFLCYKFYRFLQKRRKISTQGKAVLITGCDSGFGRLTAEHLHKKGFKVYANVYLSSNADSIRKEISSEILPLIFDVTDEKQVAEAAKKN